MYLGDTIRERRRIQRNGSLQWGEFVKGADGLIVETHAQDPERLTVRGIIEVKSMPVSERRLQLQLRHQATHDALTGLGGRVLLHECLDAAVARRRATGDGLAVVFLDLDDFKVVNDTMGHAAGDDVLVQTASRITDALARLGEGAAAFRMSGDEFAVLLLGPAAVDAAVERSGSCQQTRKGIRCAQAYRSVLEREDVAA